MDGADRAAPATSGLAPRVVYDTVSGEGGVLAAQDDGAVVVEGVFVYQRECPFTGVVTAISSFQPRSIRPWTRWSQPPNRRDHSVRVSVKPLNVMVLFVRRLLACSVAVAQ